jgi:hybrid cluster-associated redox disulfide protein
MIVTSDTIVNDLMSAHRPVIPIFIRHRMHCMGCPIGHLHTVAEACAAHGVDLAAFLCELHASLAEARPGESGKDPAGPIPAAVPPG